MIDSLPCDTNELENPALAFTIPLSSIAGPLAVSFTVSAPEQVPVQSPQQPATVEPATEPEPEPEPEPPTTTSGPPALPDAPGAPPALEPPMEQPAPTIEPFAAEPWPESSVAPSLPSGDLTGIDEEEDTSERPALLVPTDKRKFFSLSAGGATQTGYLSAYGGSLGFNSEMVLGAWGKRRPNLGGAFVMQYRKGVLTEVSLAGRLRVRKQLTKAFSLYTVFDATLGISVPVAFAGYVYPYIPSGQLGIGWGLEAILAERVTLGLRPFAPNIVGPNFGGFPVGLRWDFGVSMGVVW